MNVDALDMFLRAIHPQPIRRNLKLTRRKPERHERENPDKNPNRIRRKALKRADIHSLGAVKHLINIAHSNPAPAENVRTSPSANFQNKPS